MISRTSPYATLVALAIAASTFVAAEPLNTAQTRVVEIRVDDLNAPLGIDDPAPRFSWQLSDSARGAKQAAYQVDVFSSPALAAANKPDWSTGRIASDQSLNVRYAGPALQASHRYTLRVKVWTAHESNSAHQPRPPPRAHGRQACSTRKPGKLTGSAMKPQRRMQFATLRLSG